MTHLLTSAGEIVLQRTAYMQWLINAASVELPSLMPLYGAVKSLEIAISAIIYNDAAFDHNEQAFDLLDATDPDSDNYEHETFIKAARLVINSIKQ